MFTNIQQKFGNSQKYGKKHSRKWKQFILIGQNECNWNKVKQTNSRTNTPSERKKWNWIRFGERKLNWKNTNQKKKKKNTKTKYGCNKSSWAHKRTVTFGRRYLPIEQLIIIFWSMLSSCVVVASTILWNTWDFIVCIFLDIHLK